jgi:proteasome lid subunit RPN8/RPN11
MLRLSRGHYEAIRRHGEETYPHECCGVLLGKLREGEREVSEAIHCGNTRSDSPQNRYHIAPEELIAAQKRGREQGWDIIGFYHSHPDHPARWSATDLAEAHWFACSYVITAVEKGRAARTNSFVLCGTSEEDKRFDDESLDVIGSAATA